MIFPNCSFNHKIIIQLNTRKINLIFKKLLYILQKLNFIYHIIVSLFIFITTSLLNIQKRKILCFTSVSYIYIRNFSEIFVSKEYYFVFFSMYLKENPLMSFLFCFFNLIYP